MSDVISLFDKFDIISFECLEKADLVLNNMDDEFEGEKYTEHVNNTNAFSKLMSRKRAFPELKGPKTGSNLNRKMNFSMIFHRVSWKMVWTSQKQQYHLNVVIVMLSGI